MKPDKAKLHHLLEQLNLSEFFELCEKQGISSFELNRLKKQFILRGSNDVDFIEQLKTLVNSYPMPTHIYRMYYVGIFVAIIVALGFVYQIVMKKPDVPIVTKKSDIQIQVGGSNNGVINTGNNTTIDFNAKDTIKK